MPASAPRNRIRIQRIKTLLDRLTFSHNAMTEIRSLKPFLATLQYGLVAEGREVLSPLGN